MIRKNQKRRVKLLAMSMAVIMLFGNDTLLPMTVLAEEEVTQQTEANEAKENVDTAKAEEEAKPAKTEEAEEAAKPAKTEEAEEAAKPAKTEEAEEAAKPAKTTEAEETTEPVETTDAEEAAESAKTTEVEETTETVETTDAEETTELVETTEVEETTEPVETTDAEETTELVETTEVEEMTETVETTESEEMTEPIETTEVEEMTETVETTEVETETEEQIPEEVTVFLNAVEEMKIPKELTEENAEEFMNQYDVVNEAFTNMENAVEDYENYSGVKEAIEKMHEAEKLISKFTEGISLMAVEDPNFIDVDSFDKLQEVINSANEAESGIFTANLTADITITSALTLSKNTVQIIGSEKTITMSANFEISSSAKLILGLEDGSNTVTITGNNEMVRFYIDGGTMEMYDGVLLTKFGNEESINKYSAVYSTGTFNMNGGTISNCTAKNGGGVYIQSGTFNMSGGSITNNTAIYGNMNGGCGGGVYIASGEFNMSGGSISNNTMNRGCGGGVYIASGTVNMSGGSISNNTMHSDTDRVNLLGGGVYMNNGTFIMSGGSITNNILDSTTEFFCEGGGVYIKYGTFEMSGGASIAGNKVNPNIKRGSNVSNGGGVYINSATFRMKGESSITGNIGITGGGVYFRNGNFYMEGTSSIDHNTCKHTSITTDGGGVYINGNQYSRFEMKGSASIKNNQITGSGAGVFIMNDSLDFVIKENASITDNRAESSGGGVKLWGGKITMKDDAFIARNYANTGGTGVYMTAGSLTMEGNASIRNNNYNSINHAVNQNGGTTITMSGNASIRNNNSKGVNASGTINMSGTAYIADNNGEGVKLSGTINMSGEASIKNNKGTGINMLQNSKLNMEGKTSITNNNGSGVYVRGTFIMSGGSITKNTAYSGGGVNVTSGAVFTMSGDASIYDNNATNEGDDYYGPVTNVPLNPISGDKRLSSCSADCNEFITGWYLDAKGSRWNHSNNTKYEPDTYSDTTVALKAAHGTKANYEVIWKDVSNDKVLKSEERPSYAGTNVTVTEADKVLDGYTFDETNEGNILTAKVSVDGTTKLILHFKADIHYNIVISYDSLEFSYKATAIKWKPDKLEYEVTAELNGNPQRNITVTNKSNREVELTPSLNKGNTKAGVTYTMNLKRGTEKLATVTDKSATKLTTGEKILTCNNTGTDQDILTLEVEKVGFTSDVEEFTETLKVATISLEFKAVKEKTEPEVTN